MAAQDHVHIVREVFAAWNAHDAEGFLKRLDTKTVWESDVFPAPFAGHEGARQFFKLYVAAFPDLHLDIEQILAAGDSHVLVRWRLDRNAPRAPGRCPGDGTKGDQSRVYGRGSQAGTSDARVGLLRQRAHAPSARAAAGGVSDHTDGAVR